MTSPPNRPRAYSYLRFSTPEQQQGDSFRRQTELARAYADAHSLDLDETLTFHDLGVSAFRGRNAQRGALRAFLDAVESDVVPEGSYLLVESLDRISRDQIIQAQGLFLQIISAGVTLVTLLDQRAYSRDSINANPTDMIISLVAMMRANEESATKARRLREAWKAKRAKGGPLTSICPAWLKLEGDRFVVVEDRGAIVRRIFEMAAAGIGQHKIAETMNREEVPVFGDGKHWHRSYVVKTLANPAAMGTFVPHEFTSVNGKRVRKPLDAIPGYFPAVVHEELYQRVQAMRASTNPLRGRHAAGKVTNIFGGLAQCPLCDGRMTRVNKGRKKGGKPYLVCQRAKTGAGCVYRIVPYHLVEGRVFEAARQIIETCPAETTAGKELDARIEALETTIGAHEDHRDALLDAIRQRRSAAAIDALADEEKSLETAQADLRAALEAKAQMAPSVVAGRLLELRTALGAKDRAAANAALRSLVSGVVVDWSRGELIFRWRHDGETEVMYALPEDAPAGKVGKVAYR